MAAGSLLALLDDIASVLDDVALLTKVAGKKTAGVLGDDIALNAQQVTGVVANRELPVVWAVAKGSFVNKVILVPAALAISAFVPQAITPLLMLGGFFLCYEGVEKIVHSYFHRQPSAHLDLPPSGQAGADVQVVSGQNPVGLTPEQSKIKGAIRTDFILSAEIIAITLGTVATAAFTTQVIVVSSIALIMTVGVYGLVAGIVKLDDAGLYLCQRQGDSLFSGALRGFGAGILAVAPYLMKSLSIAGTAAMFLVGGGILVHGIPGAEAFIHKLVPVQEAGASGLFQSAIALITPVLANAVIGIAAGAIVMAVLGLLKRMRG